MFSLSLQRAYSLTARRLTDPVAASSASLVLNFCTPHAPVYNNKTVSMVMLPGESGEYGVTVGHSPLIAQLKPGVVSVVHTGGEIEKFFVPGGFALTHANSVTDVSVPEAFPLKDFDEASVKAGYADALKNVNSDNVQVKATAQIEVNVYSSLARALGITI